MDLTNEGQVVIDGRPTADTRLEPQSLTPDVNIKRDGSRLDPEKGKVYGLFY
jgi:hypothetical protein